MNFFKKVLAVVATLAFAGLLALPIRDTSSSYGIRMSSVKASVENGSIFAILGGFRSLIADFVWIKGYVNWETKDVAKCISAIELASSIDPDMTMFWTQGASIIAFDTPHWLLAQLPEKLRTDEKLDFFKKRQAMEAIKFIDKALAMFPNSYEFLIQKGQIAISIKKFDVAQECFGAASKLNDGFYARRIYASILVKNGEYKKAKDVLKGMLADAEHDNPVRALIEAQLNVVEKLIEKTAQ